MEKRKFSYEKNAILGRRARDLIPGGAHTYSKGDDQFPSNAPKIIERGKGCRLWDVDGNEFVDMAMSLGTAILGHAYEPVLEAVRNELGKGVNFCRPAMIEGDLAEIVCDLIPSAEMVKFGKNGSDAVTAAVKLARAYTGRKYIARCSADPFNSIHDWFIGSTELKRGIPEDIQKLTLKFHYNDLASCQRLLDQYPGEIACFIFEPVSFTPPQEGFLQGLKNICEKNGAVLIFDEVVSGFRWSIGGAQELFGVTPHLSAFGKAMANGFSISALVGQRDLMRLGGIEHDQERVFLLSTTNGGETHCLAASIATIKAIKDTNAIEHFWKTGQALMDGVNRVALDVGAEKYVSTTGYGCRPGFAFKDETGEVTTAARTLFLQETVGRGLMMPYVIPCLAHDEQTLKFALDVIRDALIAMKSAADKGGMLAAVEGPLIKPVFRKFN